MLDLYLKVGECNRKFLHIGFKNRWTSRWIRSGPSWTRSPTSETYLWSPTWIMASPLWPTRWCPKRGSSLQPRPERCASQTPAKTSRSAASPSNRRECWVLKLFLQAHWKSLAGGGCLETGQWRHIKCTTRCHHSLRASPQFWTFHGTLGSQHSVLI